MYKYGQQCGALQQAKYKIKITHLTYSVQIHILYCHTVEMLYAIFIKILMHFDEYI